jgi:hypothetical protein
MRFEVFPHVPRGTVMAHIVDRLAQHETVFSDYNSMCDEKCYSCPRCQRALTTIAYTLTKPNTIVWEVWDPDSVDLAGILYVTDVNLGCDAKAHYAFFDNDLWGKTSVVESVIDWLFHDHEGWPALNRLTIEIPDFAFALAAHASRKLGFGGDTTYQARKKNGKVSRTIPVEGVKRKALRWRNTDRDVLVLGRLNEAT